MSLQFKPGVVVLGIKTELILGLVILSEVMKELGYDCIVTSSSESKHGAQSRHYLGYGSDVRTHGILEADKDKIVEETKRRLPSDQYILFIEARGKAYEHFHMHFKGVPQEMI